MRWISNKELKIYLLLVGAVTLLALLITIFAFLPGYLRYNKSMKQSEKVIAKTIDISKFMIPESYKKLSINGWVHFLPDKDKWTWSDIEPYWQDPEELIVNYLEEQNETLIDDIFKDIP